MGIIVVNRDGNRMPIGRSYFRYFLSSFSVILLGIGHLFVFFSSKKQTAHDMVAKTYVIHGTKGSGLLDEWLIAFRALFGGSQSRSARASSGQSELTSLAVLERLHRLRQEGALTESEYQEQKQKALKLPR